MLTNDEYIADNIEESDYEYDCYSEEQGIKQMEFEENERKQMIPVLKKKLNTRYVNVAGLFYLLIKAYQNKGYYYSLMQELAYADSDNVGRVVNSICGMANEISNDGFNG